MQPAAPSETRIMLGEAQQLGMKIPSIFQKRTGLKTE
jgi:hypothetical protein